MNISDFNAFNRELWERGARYDGARHIPVTLTPYCFESSEYQSLAAAAQEVLGALEVVGNLYCEDERIRSRFPELSDLESYIACTPAEQRKIGIARFDYIKGADGALRMLETNTDCPGGMSVAGIVHRAFRRSPFYDRNLVEFDQESEDPVNFVKLMQSLSGKDRPRLGFFWSRVSPILNDIQALHDIATGFWDWPTPYIGPVQDMQFSERGEPLAAGIPVDFAFMKIDTMIAPSGMVHWCAWKDDIAESRQLLAAMAGGKLRTVSGLPAILVTENKRTLALLFEPDVRSSFTAAQRHAIDHTVARTARLEADRGQGLWTHEEVRRWKDRFVLKSPLDTRGRGVYIGREQSSDAWERLLIKACAGHMVVQEYIEPLNESLELEPGKWGKMGSVLALYMYGGRPAGIFARSSAAGVVNVGNGGMIRPALVIRGRRGPTTPDALSTIQPGPSSTESWES
jgi:diaminobutyrate-2-oxoglutarate transaminase